MSLQKLQVHLGLPNFEEHECLFAHVDFKRNEYLGLIHRVVTHEACLAWLILTACLPYLREEPGIAQNLLNRCVPQRWIIVSPARCADVNDAILLAWHLLLEAMHLLLLAWHLLLLAWHLLLVVTISYYNQTKLKLN